jgi:xanthine/uracil/vitamin C permease (AzgA family)
MVIIASFFILLGFLLYQIKKGALIVFGVIEFVGGMFIIWAALVSPSPENLTNAIALGGGLFLIVKGMEDSNKGKKVEDDEKKVSTDNKHK